MSCVVCLSLVSTPTQAFEPLSLLTGIIGPLACKIIGCKQQTTNYLFVERPAESNKRLKEIRENFKWGDYYEEGECTDAKTALDKSLTVCYTNKEWKVIK